MEYIIQYKIYDKKNKPIGKGEYICKGKNLLDVIKFTESKSFLNLHNESYLKVVSGVKNI